MAGIKIDYEKRIFGFDLLRALAIFFVVHGHGRHLLKGTMFENFPGFGFPHGVNIFFVLSGFLIGYSFIVNANNTNGKLSLKKSFNFWKRSALRILPNYYLILIVNYILVNSGILNGSTEEFSIWRFATFTQNLFYSFYDFFWESWSLATQEWFYLLFPILLMILGRFVKLKYNVLIISIIFIVAAIAYRISISDIEYDSFWWDVSVRKVALSRIDCIYFGVIGAWVRFYFKNFWSKCAIPSFILGILIFCFISIYPHKLNTVYLNVIYLSLAPIYIILLFPFIDKLKDVKTVFGKIISKISVLSYAMYLLNLMIIQIFTKYFSNVLTNHATLKYAIFWVVVLGLSYLLYMLYENPISRYGNKIFHTTKMMYKRIGVSENLKLIASSVNPMYKKKK